MANINSFPVCTNDICVPVQFAWGSFPISCSVCLSASSWQVLPVHLLLLVYLHYACHFPVLLPCTVGTSIASASKLHTLHKDAVSYMPPQMRTVARSGRPGLGSSTLFTVQSSSSLVHTFSLSPWTDVAFQLGYCFCVCLDYARGPTKPVFRRAAVLWWEMKVYW